jgi:hypothetical protein
MNTTGNAVLWGVFFVNLIPMSPHMCINWCPVGKMHCFNCLQCILPTKLQVMSMCDSKETKMAAGYENDEYRPAPFIPAHLVIE